MTDYAFGAKSSLLYSTASIFFAGTIDKRDVLFLFGDGDQSHEFTLSLAGNTGVRASQADVKFSTKQNSKGLTTVTVLPGVKGLVTVFESDSQLVLFSDPVTAATFWAPTIPAASGDLKSFWQFGSNSTILIGGPYLVRNATITGSGQLALRGDLNASAMLTVIGPSSVKSVSWNGESVSTDAAASASGNGRSSAIRTGRLTTKVNTSGVKVPTLSNWKFADSLPEVQASFSDADWTVANHTTTNITDKPLFGDGRVLFGSYFSS